MEGLASSSVSLGCFKGFFLPPLWPDMSPVTLYPGPIFYVLLFISETMEKKLVEETKQLEIDLNDERLRYQNLLNEFSRLEERYDDLKEEMTLMLVSPTLVVFFFKESVCVTQASLRP